MKKDGLSGIVKTNRPVLFVLFLVGGLAVFLFGSNTYRVFVTNKNLDYDWILTLILLVVAVILRRSMSLQKYWEIAFALFIASFANATNWYLGTWLEHLLPPATSAAQTLAIDKVSQAIPIVLAILLLTGLPGYDLGSIFLKKGNLKQGLRFGLISFGVCALIFAVIAVLQSNASSGQGLFATGVSLGTIIAAIPYILVFVFANAFMEELWFRGIFLRKLSPFLGAAATIGVTALVFGITHSAATYIAPIEMILFTAVVFLLGLVNGYIMLKTDSIWGSVLFHAGYDLLIIIPVLVSLG